MHTIASVQSGLDVPQSQDPPRFLILYGSLRQRSYSRFAAEYAGGLLESWGAEVRYFDPTDLPIFDRQSYDHPEVQKLRDLAAWSQGMVWSCPEVHGAMCGVFKNQIDWIPLKDGAVRPTQGKTLALIQVNGGSQSFNVVNQMRILGRWMRMFTIPNQSSIAKAWKEFEDDGTFNDSSFKNRVIDVMEELLKITLLLRDREPYLSERYSEQKSIAETGKLQKAQGI